MNNHEKELVGRLEAMPLEQARHEISTGAFGGIGGPDHAFCLSWLADKEAVRRDIREGETLRIARRANKLAIGAIIVSVITAIGVTILQWWLLAQKH